MSKDRPQTFNDGLVRIYRVKDDSENGEKPVETIVLKKTLRYKEKTIGISRYWQANQNNVRVDLFLRCPYQSDISPQDLAIPNDRKQYRITRITKSEDTTPQVMDIELQRVEQDYDVESG